MLDAISSDAMVQSQVKLRPKVKFATRYDAFCRRQESEGLLWYLLPLMTLPTIVMPVSIIAMSYLTGYIPFIGVSILLFFTNIILSIAKQSQKTIITCYLVTLLFHILLPLLVFTFLVVVG